MVEREFAPSEDVPLKEILLYTFSKVKAMANVLIKIWSESSLVTPATSTSTFHPRYCQCTPYLLGPSNFLPSTSGYWVETEAFPSLPVKLTSSPEALVEQ
jgi:hypothetical protein